MCSLKNSVSSACCRIEIKGQVTNKEINQNIKHMYLRYNKYDSWKIKIIVMIILRKS